MAYRHHQELRRHYQNTTKACSACGDSGILIDQCEVPGCEMNQEHTGPKTAIPCPACKGYKPL